MKIKQFKVGKIYKNKSTDRIFLLLSLPEQIKDTRAFKMTFLDEAGIQKVNHSEWFLTQWVEEVK